MSRRTLLPALLAAGLLLAGVALFVGRERQFDPGFDSRVADPAYRGGGPTVLYDGGHHNTHAADGGYKPLLDLLRSDGYTVRVGRGELTGELLQGVAVLVVVGARGANDANDDPAFTAVEVDLVESWVRGGGSLLLVTDHWPFGSAAESLARRFGVGMGKGLVQDPAHCDPERGDSHLLFTEENGLLRDHPVVRGRNESERVRRVLTFTGQSIEAPPGATTFLALSDQAVEGPPGPARVDRSGGNVRVSMEYGEPVPAAGRAQGLAMEFGRGRLVVLGEAGMLRAQKESRGRLVGMNVPGIDNRRLALNILHWLSRAV